MELTDEKHLSVIDRYYTRKYRTDIKGQRSHDQCILLHSNKVCVVTVAKSHPVLTEQKKILSVNFQVEEGFNRMDNKVSGKGKKGAQKMTGDSQLCSVSCEDGSVYTFVSCVKGMLLEVNENLLKSPQLISHKADTDGYLAIVLPQLREYAAVISKLQSEETYLQKLKQRENDCLSNSPDTVQKDND